MLDMIYKMTMLTAECQQVVGLRAWKMTLGGAAAADEARMMWSEKTEAALRYGPAFMAGGSLDRMVDDYRGIVQANALRLTDDFACS